MTLGAVQFNFRSPFGDILFSSMTVANGVSSVEKDAVSLFEPMK
jgi:hypothetical protein